MFRYILWVALLGLALGDESFFEIDPEFKHLHRQLLETPEEETEVKKPEHTTETKEPVKIEASNGPERFFAQSEDVQFMMTVKGGITLKTYKDGKHDGKIVLSEEAPAVTFSSIKHDKTELKSWQIFQVDIDWKDKVFIGKENQEINGAHIEMNFNVTKKGFKLTKINVDRLGGENPKQPVVDLKVKNKSTHGYTIEAPTGLSFGCGDLGVFEPKNVSESGRSVGIIFPHIQIQVGKIKEGKFGPLWECGVLLPIGLWVGIIISLFFAIICCWGFSMLASINTMDRFDDPKGKSINVPNTD